MSESSGRIVWLVPDAIFADSRLAAIYDDIDGDRSDLDHYEAIVDEFGARRVLDLGCGTGTFACRLAARGLTVIAVDPASASLNVARGKPGAQRVTWLLGDATTLPPMAVDAAMMTANVAQVFVHDQDWSATLGGVRGVLRDGGHLVFETRDPSFRGSEEWTREQFLWVTETVAGRVENRVELTEVALPLVSFCHTVRFLDSGDVVTSHSMLRLRDREEITDSLTSSGFTIDEICDAPDRPGREFVVIAHPFSE